MLTHMGLHVLYMTVDTVWMLVSFCCLGRREPKCMCAFSTVMV